jgi:hypothetical protein
LRRPEGPLAAFVRTSARALEAEQDRWFLWLPVLFAAGILTYFALTDEPHTRLATKLHTEMVRAPVLAHELRYAAVTGFVEAHELRDKGRARLTLRVLTLDHLAPSDRPYRVRVSLAAGEARAARIGQAVSLQATLQPLPEPVEPGGQPRLSASNRRGLQRRQLAARRRR